MLGFPLSLSWRAYEFIYVITVYENNTILHKIVRQDIDFINESIAEQINEHFTPPPPEVLPVAELTEVLDDEPQQPQEPAEIAINEYALRDPLLFGDYRNAMEEGEPRFYEDMLDYQAVSFLFEEVRVTRGSLSPSNWP